MTSSERFQEACRLMLEWCDANTMSDTPTPRTDAAHEATLTSEYEGAEHVAWEFARKLERELNNITSAKVT